MTRRQFVILAATSGLACEGTVEPKPCNDEVPEANVFTPTFVVRGTGRFIPPAKPSADVKEKE